MTDFSEKRRENPSCQACVFHPNIAAYARCVSCGAPLCSHCSLGNANAIICRVCAIRQPTYWSPSTQHFQQARGYEAGSFPPLPGANYPERKPGLQERLFGDKPDIKERTSHKWEFSDVLAVLVFIFIFYAASGVVLLLLYPNAEAPQYILYLVFFSPALLLTSVIVAGKYGDSVRELFTLESPQGFNAGKVFLIGSAGIAANFFLTILIYSIIEAFTSDGRELIGEELFSGTTLEKTLMILTVVVAAPVFEEIFFRGLLYPSLKAKMPMALAIFINGLIFSGFHMSVLSLPGLLVLGMAIAYSYEITGDLRAPVLIHFMNNGLVVLIAVLTSGGAL